MSDTQILAQIAHALEAFKQDAPGKKPTVIVSAKIFAEIMHCLEDVKVDKNYSKGKFGGVTIKSDFLVQDDNMIVTRPPEWDDKFPPHEYLLPTIPPFRTLYQKKREALKERVKKKEDKKC